ncbi:hypothetical protein BDZ88DRAFT_433966 [Geranomyces variabilis]|nr:hypothetical protein BDZ88DRAFT_433966 [Geranomyces variabilis]
MMFEENSTPHFTLELGEVENKQRRDQLDKFRPSQHRRGSGSWKHDGIAEIRLTSSAKSLPVFFLEVTGGPQKVGDDKFREDQRKLFKAMNLAFTYLNEHIAWLGIPEETASNICESHGCLVHGTTITGFRMYKHQGAFVVNEAWVVDIPTSYGALKDTNTHFLGTLLLEVKSRILDFHAAVATELRNIRSPSRRSYKRSRLELFAPSPAKK